MADSVITHGWYSHTTWFYKTTINIGFRDNLVKVDAINTFPLWKSNFHHFFLDRVIAIGLVWNRKEPSANKNGRGHQIGELDAGVTTDRRLDLQNPVVQVGADRRHSRAKDRSKVVHPSG